MTRIFSDRAPSGDAAPVGRGATTRSHGIEVLEGRSSNAHACRSTFQHLESCLRQTHPASVDSRSAVFPSFSSREKGPQRTSREGINPSPTDSPNDTVRVGRTPLYVPSKKKSGRPRVAQAEPSCPWRDEPGRWVAGTNAGVRIGHTPSRWRRSETVADSAVRAPNPCHPRNPPPKLRRCDDSNPMRWIREIPKNPRSSASNKCDGSVRSARSVFKLG